MRKALVLLLFLAPAIQYRAELGPLSLATLEPIVLLCGSILLASEIVRSGRIRVPREPLLYAFIAIALWAFTVRPWSSNFQAGLSDVRDWVIPMFGFVALIASVRRGWRFLILAFAVLVSVSALLGVYQHVADGFRPFTNELASFKTGFVLSAEDNMMEGVSYSVGLFAHPNAFAMYLFAGFMILLGSVFSQHRAWWQFVLLGLVGITLFWTYAKASMLVMVVSIVVFVLLRIVKVNQAVAIMALGGIAAALTGWWLFAHYADQAFWGTFQFRVDLWDSAIELIAHHPAVLLIGNGMDMFAERAQYAQPHSVYVYILLQYGLAGITWLALLGFLIIKRGWQEKRKGLFALEPVLLALWVLMLSYLLIGLVESNLLGVESRMIYLSIVACFIGLSRELATERQQDEWSASCP